MKTITFNDAIDFCKPCFRFVRQGKGGNQQGTLQASAAQPAVMMWNNGKTIV